MLGRLVHCVNTIPLAFFIRGYRRILDIGCGVNSPVNYFVTSSQELDGIDIHAPVLALQAKTKYQRVIVNDIRTFELEKQYDVITALDFIEHLEKDDGVQLLNRLERVAQRLIVITPNGYVAQPAVPENPFLEHKCGWTPAEFRARGYRVYGMFGPKSWREGSATLKYRPKFLWGILDLIASFVYFFLPGRSFSILAIFDKK